MSLIPAFLSGRRLDGPARFDGPVFHGTGNGVRVATLTGTDTLTINSAQFQKLNGGLANRDVNLPAEPLSKGLSFRVVNSGATNDLLVKSDAPATIATLAVGKAAWFACDGTTWAHLGIETITL